MAPAHSKPVLTPPVREHAIRGIIRQLTQLYLASRTRISRAVYLTLFIALVYRVRNAIAEQKAASARDAAERAERAGATSSLAAADGQGGGDAATAKEEEKKKKKKVELNREFFRGLLRLLRIVVPGWRSKEMRLLISHSFFLVVRTLISLRVAAMDGAIVKSLVKGHGKEFLMRIVWWMLIAVPATFTNSMVPLCALPRRAARGAISLTAIPRCPVVLPPGRIVAEVPHAVDAPHPRHIPVSVDLLWHFGAG
jgi:ATP-binding cassette subfamily D (ALD) long-chain fatty acid import protein